MEIKEIYVVAPFPMEDNIKDGMVQRIKAVDALLSGFKRTYVNLNLKNPIYKKIIHSENVTELVFNPIFPLFIVIHFILKAKIIYIHSIHPFKFLFYSFLFLSKNKKNIILDAHGVVPEELLLYKKPIKFYYMLWIERMIFNKLSHCICVSRTMAKHFQSRFRKYDIQYHILFTSELLSSPTDKTIDILIEELNIKPSETVLIYSGNAQMWQKIPRMMESIRIFNEQKFKIIILTGEMAIFKDYLIKYKIDPHNIILRSVMPSQLSMYYAISHYGYILRDDILVNKVANPTKMLEYLQFGIIPIVLSPDIGDYHELGYEYVNVNNIDATNLSPAKSKKNVEIAKIMSGQTKVFDMKVLIDNN